jgi:hypothetical protein
MLFLYLEGSQLLFAHIYERGFLNDNKISLPSSTYVISLSEYDIKKLIEKGCVISNKDIEQLNGTSTESNGTKHDINGHSLMYTDDYDINHVQFIGVELERVNELVTDGHGFNNTVMEDKKIKDYLVTLSGSSLQFVVRAIDRESAIKKFMKSINQHFRKMLLQLNLYLNYTIPLVIL